KGDTARLLSVIERSRSLLGTGATARKQTGHPRKKQMSLFDEVAEAVAERGWGETGAPEAGATTLDRVHQAMLLFGAGRADALRRFVLEQGVGNQPAFWKLAQSLSALYPAGTNEKRWVEGVLARKKGLGFG